MLELPEGYTANVESCRSPVQTDRNLWARRPVNRGTCAKIGIALRLRSHEAAADFAFEGNRLMVLLNPHLHRDGMLPQFEVLLQTSSIGGSAPESNVVAYRIDQD
jgi:hypothetical protein